MFHAHGIFALTPETGPPDADVYKALKSQSMGDAFYEYGFWPPKETIQLYANDSVSANMKMMWMTGPCYDISVLQVGEAASIQLQITNVGVNDTTVRPPLTVTAVTANQQGIYQQMLSVPLTDVAAPKRNQMIHLDVFIEKGMNNEYDGQGSVLVKALSDSLDTPLWNTPWIVIGDGLTCMMYHIGKDNSNTKGATPHYPVLHQRHVRHCEVCALLLSNSGSGGPTTPSPAAAAAGTDNTNGETDNGQNSENGQNSGTGGSVATTPAPSISDGNGQDDNTKKNDENTKNANTKNANNQNGSGKGGAAAAAAAAAAAVPCSPVASGGANVVSGSPSSNNRKTIDWNMLWVGIGCLVVFGCSCGCVMMACLKKYSQSEKRYGKLTILEEEDDEGGGGRRSGGEGEMMENGVELTMKKYHDNVEPE
jgi:hypothetical protein